MSGGLRDMYASKAMGALIAVMPDADADVVAAWAYRYADAMLVERARNRPAPKPQPVAPVVRAAEGS